MDAHDGQRAVIGTYVKVIEFHERDEAFVVLYVRPDGCFLFAGYWRGRERSTAAGRWSLQGTDLVLDGRGRLWTDDGAAPPSPQFHRVFSVGRQNATPVLNADRSLDGWSLLAWTGPFTFVGRDTVIASDGTWLPSSLSAVDAWIAHRMTRDDHGR